MLYEAEIVIRRRDPDQLIEDFQAATALLERRQAARRQRPGPGVSLSRRDDPPTAADAISTAERIIGDTA